MQLGPDMQNSSERLDAILDEDPEELFEMLEEIGKGAYGSVHKALCKATGQIVAIKVVPNNEQIAILQKQILILEQCKSDYIVKYFGSYFKGEYLWIVMEYCAAGSISDLIRICERELRQQEIASILQAILRGLEYLHSNRKIHRDVKAGNILLDQKGNAKLADFGVSAEITTNAKRDTVIGSPYWMSPEMLSESKYDQKTDIWSLGITCIEIAEGAAPYSNMHPYRAMFVIKKNPIKGLAERHKWSDEFHNLVESCLQLKAGERPSARQLLNHPFITKKSRGKAILAQLFCNSIDAIEKERVKENKRKLTHENQNSLQMKFVQENKNSIKPTNSIKSYRNQSEEEEFPSSGTLVVKDTLKESPSAETEFVKFAKQMKEADIIYFNKNEVNNLIDNFQVKREDTEEEIRERIRQYDAECERQINLVVEKYKKQINGQIDDLKRLYNKSVNKNDIKAFQLTFHPHPPPEPRKFKRVKNINNINNINSINISIAEKKDQQAKEPCTNCANLEKEKPQVEVNEGFKKVKKYQQFIEDPEVLQYLRKTYLKKKTEH